MSFCEPVKTIFFFLNLIEAVKDLAVRVFYSEINKKDLSQFLLDRLIGNVRH